MIRIFLIGYMASGKTSTGKLLAAQLGLKFVDMDAHIVEKSGKTIPEIFSVLGEESFRKLEREALQEMAKIENAVISTGGGAPCFFDNIEYMNTHVLTIYLKYSPEQLTARLSVHPEKRPLVAAQKPENLLDFVRNGLAMRDQFYNQATLKLTGTNDEIVQAACDYLASL